jgi:hypothetical protein
MRGVSTNNLPISPHRARSTKPWSYIAVDGGDVCGKDNSRIGRFSLSTHSVVANGQAQPVAIAIRRGPRLLGTFSQTKVFENLTKTPLATRKIHLFSHRKRFSIALHLDEFRD